MESTVVRMAVPSCGFPSSFSMSQLSTGNQILLRLIIEEIFWNGCITIIKRKKEPLINPLTNVQSDVELGGEKLFPKKS